MKVYLHRIVFIFIFLFLFSLAAASAQAVTSGPAQGLALDEARSLVFSPLAGAVLVLDISDPTDPQLVSDSIQTQGVVQDLFYDAAQQRLYIAADEGDLEIWDLQTPSAPQQISVTSLYYFGVEVPVVSVAAAGDYAYVSTSWGYLHWLDISDPANPVDFGFNGQGGNPSREVMVADDGFVYLSGPDTVRYVINSNGSLSLAGSNIYATSYELYTAAGYIYISTGTGPFQILDANAPGLPFVSTYSTNNIKDIFVAGDYAYIANLGAGLRVLDVSDKANPTEVGFDDSASATDVLVSGNYAYVRGGNASFRVVDVSAANNPVVVGNFDPGSPGGGGGGGGGNIAPTADAGPAQTVLSRARVTLDGSGSNDVDGTIASYSWTQLSGPPVNLRGADTAQPFFRAPRARNQPGFMLTFELTVTDDDGASSSDEVTITVIPR